MRTTRQYKMTMAVAVGLSVAGQALAGSSLSIHKVSSEQAQLRLTNDKSVAAIQFTVTSTGPEIVEVAMGHRMDSREWQLSSHRTSDRTLNVVLIRTSAASLASGDGVIASLTIRGTVSGVLSLSRVILATPDAQSIPTTLVDLTWTVETEALASLGQNYPNPFNPMTTIPYTLEQESKVGLVVYDMAGREIKRIAEGTKNAGSYTAVWDGTDEFGFRVSSGTYVVRLEAGSHAQTRKMVLTK